MSDLSPKPYHRGYEITDPIFAIFRSPGGSRLFWKLFLLQWLGLAAVTFLVGIPMLSETYSLMVASAEQRFDDVRSPLIRILLLTVGLITLYAGIMAIVRSAFYRSYFQNETVSGLPFRLGRDEGRVFLSILGFYAIYLGVTIVLTFLFGNLIGWIAMDGDQIRGGPILMLSLFYVAVLFVAAIWYMVRFSPAAPLTALRGRTHVLGARHVSKNRFWAIFGTGLAAGVIGYVVYYAVSWIGTLAGLSGLMTWELFQAFRTEDFETVSAALEAAVAAPGFKIGLVIAVLAASAGAAFYQLIIAGPPAFFTRQWRDADTYVPPAPEPF